MKKLTAAFLLILPFLVFFSCKKENDKLQWDIDVLGPVFKTSLSMADLIPDSFIYAHPDSAIDLVYEGDVFETPLDSIFQIPDTTVTTVIAIGIPLTLPHGTPFYHNPNAYTRLTVTSVELYSGIIKSGYAKLFATNYLQTKVFYRYTIPEAKLNGVPLDIVQSVDPAPVGGVTTFTGLFDLSGYNINLTGPSHNSFNTITYNIDAWTDSAGSDVTVGALDTIGVISTGFVDIIPLYGKGYLGQSDIEEGPLTKGISVTNILQSGNISLEDVKLKLSIQNYIGADATLVVKSLQSIKNSGSTIDLVAPNIINYPVNINRALETGAAPSPVIHTNYEIQIDKTNSNLLPFLENLPDSFKYNVHISVNPLGNISGNNDFIYSDSLINAKLRIEMPFKFAADHLTLVDTQSLALSDTTALDPIGTSTFTLIADNGFPFQMNLQLFIIDANNKAIDSLFVPDVIAPASLDASLRAIGKMRTTILIPVDEHRKQELQNVSRIAIRASLTTPGYPQHLQIYSDYRLDLKLVASVHYLIR